MSTYDRSNEADRIRGNMCTNSSYHGTTTPSVVDEICSNYGSFLYCNGYGRKMVFTPITANTISYKTVPA